MDFMPELLNYNSHVKSEKWLLFIIACSYQSNWESVEDKCRNRQVGFKLEEYYWLARGLGFIGKQMKFVNVIHLT